MEASNIPTFKLNNSFLCPFKFFNTNLHKKKKEQKLGSRIVSMNSNHSIFHCRCGQKSGYPNHENLKYYAKGLGKQKGASQVSKGKTGHLL